MRCPHLISTFEGTSTKMLVDVVFHAQPTKFMHSQYLKSPVNTCCTVSVISVVALNSVHITSAFLPSGGQTWSLQVMEVEQIIPSLWQNQMNEMTHKLHVGRHT